MAYTRVAVALIVCSVVFPLAAFCVVLLRLKAKHIARKRLDTSDYVLFVTMVIAIGNAITCIIGATDAGIGDSLEVLTPQTEVAFMKILFASQFFYIFSVFTVKVSIVLFYKTVFVSHGFRKAADGVLVILGAWIVAFFFVTLFQDKPINRNWGTVGTTVNFPVLYIVESVTDITLDLVILAMPLPVIRSLHISAKKRWLLSGIFWLGAFCVIASTLRLYYMVLFRSDYRLGRVADFSQTVVLWILWGAIEPCTSIIAACLPTLGPLLWPIRRRAQDKHWTSSLSYTKNSHTRNNTNNSRGIRTETSVHVKNRAMDSMECLALEEGFAGDGGCAGIGVGLPGEGGAGGVTEGGVFGTHTEVEGGEGVPVLESPLEGPPIASPALAVVREERRGSGGSEKR